MMHVKIINWDTAGNGSLPAGTSNIGTVGIAAGTAAMGNISLIAGTANIGSLLAGTGNIGFVTATEQGGVIRYNGVTTAIQYAVIALTTSVNAIVVTSVSAKQIVALGLVLAGSPAMQLSFFSSAATAISGALFLLAGTPLVMPRNLDGWFAPTTAGQSLTLTPSVSGSVGGAISYIVV